VRHVGRNSDLYLEVRANSLAFSSRARRACSISWFLRSTSTSLLSELCALFARQLLVGLLQFFCCICSSVATAAIASTGPSVCIVASILLSTMPMLAVSCSRNARCEVVKLLSDASFDYGFDTIFESTGRTITLRGVASNNPERIANRVRRQVGDQHAVAFPQRTVLRVLRRLSGRRRWAIFAIAGRRPTAVSSPLIARLPSGRSRLAARLQRSQFRQ